MSGEHRASIEERIAWTKGFHSPADKVVLLALARSADFDTGRNAHPSVKTLLARTGLSKRSLHRTLRRLERELWIFARPWHRHATVYDLNLDRLATQGPGTAPVVPPAPRFPWLFVGCQFGTQIFWLAALSANLALKSLVGNLSAKFAFLSARLALLPVIRTRKRKDARARAELHDQKLPGLIGTARPPPASAAAPTRGPTQLDGVTRPSGCGHTPNCRSFEEHRQRIHADVEAARDEREKKHG